MINLSNTAFCFLFNIVDLASFLPALRLLFNSFFFPKNLCHQGKRDLMRKNILIGCIMDLVIRTTEKDLNNLRAPSQNLKMLLIIDV